MPDKLRGFGILTPVQKAFLSVFAFLPDQSQFVLAGGTALAEYYFGHRLLFDLDIFTGVDGLVLPTSYQIEKTCAKCGLQVNVVRRFSSFSQFLVTQGQESLKVDIAFDSPYHFESPILTEFRIFVNDYANLRVDILLAYFGRAEPRDAVDLYFIMERAASAVIGTGSTKRPRVRFVLVRGRAPPRRLLPGRTRTLAGQDAKTL